MNRNHRFIDVDELRLIGVLFTMTLIGVQFLLMQHLDWCLGCGGVELAHPMTPQEEALLERRMANLVERMVYATLGLVVLSIVGRLGWEYRREIVAWSRKREFPRIGP